MRSCPSLVVLYSFIAEMIILKYTNTFDKIPYMECICAYIYKIGSTFFRKEVR